MLSNSTPPAPQARTWSTDHVSAGERLDYWVGAICEAFLEMDCSSRAATCFDGHLTHLQTGQIAINRVQASTQDVYRTPGAIARSSRHPFYLITQTEQAWHVRQGGQAVHLRPGDAVLVDAAQVYELHFPQAVSCLSVQMPRAWVGEWLRQVEVGGVRVVHRDRGWGAVLSALCTQLGRQPELALQAPDDWLESQFGVLLGAALEPDPTVPEASSAGLHARALTLMSQHLDRPGWSVTELAIALGVSVRSLQRAFTRVGETVLGCWRRMRMERACRLLAQGRLANLSVAAVALRCGYPDPAHFSRDFQRETGQTPLRWARKQRGL